MKQAADRGDVSAQKEMVKLYLSSASQENDIELLAASVDYYHRAAQKGNLESAMHLGRYFRGAVKINEQESSPCEPQQALKYWELAQRLIPSIKNKVHQFNGSNGRFPSDHF